jgi:hypothetical protein
MRSSELVPPIKGIFIVSIFRSLSAGVAVVSKRILLQQHNREHFRALG